MTYKFILNNRIMKEACFIRQRGWLGQQKTIAIKKHLVIRLSLILLKKSQQCKAGRERGYFINPKTPTPHNQPMEGRKSENNRK